MWGLDKSFEIRVWQGQHGLQGLKFKLLVREQDGNLDTAV